MSIDAQQHILFDDNVSNFVRHIDQNDLSKMKGWYNVILTNPLPKTRTYKKLTYKIAKHINDVCNAKPYEVSVTWPNFEEFLQNKTADCKGYATCKYYLLRKFDISPDDINLWSGVYNGQSHVTIVVSIDDKEIMLDAGAESNLPEAKDVFHKRFRPSFRFNEIGWDIGG